MSSTGRAVSTANCTLTVTHHRSASSSIALSARSPRKHKAKATTTTVPVSNIKFVPEAHWHDDNGWQVTNEDVRSRVSALFNCYTMSDVIFQVDVYQIPAHRFILASASPVFYRQLYDEAVGSPWQGSAIDSGEVLWQGGGFMGSSMRNNVITLSISDVPHLAFFEFLQFIYTDTVHLSLDNVLPLIFLADTYRVAGLSDRCLEFLKREVSPTGVFRVIRVLRKLMLKAFVGAWRGVLTKKRHVEQFRELSLAERRAKMEEAGGTHVSSVPSSCRNSVCSRKSGGSLASRASRATSLYGGAAKTPRGSIYCNDDDESSVGERHSITDLAQVSPRKVHRIDKDLRDNWSFLAKVTETKISVFVEDLTKRCWWCIRMETAAVISSDDMWDQDVAMWRQILKLESCSVQEVELFQAVCEWADRRCKQCGLAPTAENKRLLLDEETIELLRFPAMTSEQFQWEVVPTGLLRYEDVQTVLYGGTHSRYDGTPRYNVSQRREALMQRRRGISDLSENLDTPTSELTTPRGLLCPDAAPIVRKSGPHPSSESHLHHAEQPGDPIDSMLRYELLRTYLKGAVEPTSLAGVTIAERELPGSTSRDRLPPIGRSCRGMLQPEPLPVQTPGGPSPSRRGMERTPSQMVMGILVDEQKEQEEDNVAGQGSRKDALPEDFARVAPGMYRFRDERLLELWLKEGQIMVHDHGPSHLFKPTMHNIPQAASCGNATALARRAVGLGEEAPSSGIPLASFLRGL